jgi:hypothetical protein
MMLSCTSDVPPQMVVARPAELATLAGQFLRAHRGVGPERGQVTGLGSPALHLQGRKDGGSHRRCGSRVGLLYRMLTCWIPVVIGWPVMRWLTNNEMV